MLVRRWILKSIIIIVSDQYVFVFWVVTYLGLDCISVSDSVILIQFTYSQAEIAQLHVAVKEYEDIIREYKVQVG